MLNPVQLYFRVFPGRILHPVGISGTLPPKFVMYVDFQVVEVRATCLLPRTIATAKVIGR